MGADIWLFDSAGETVIEAIVQSSDTGSENIETEAGESIEGLMLKWQLALMSKHSTTSGVGLDLEPRPSYLFLIEV